MFVHILVYSEVDHLRLLLPQACHAVWLMYRDQRNWGHVEWLLLGLRPGYLSILNYYEMVALSCFRWCGLRMITIICYAVVELATTLLGGLHIVWVFLALAAAVVTSTATLFLLFILDIGGLSLVDSFSDTLILWSWCIIASQHWWDSGRVSCLQDSRLHDSVLDYKLFDILSCVVWLSWHIGLNHINHGFTNVLVVLLRRRSPLGWKDSEQ